VEGNVAAGEVDNEVWRVEWRLVKRKKKCGGKVAAGEADNKV
jgi:hypothetical protein